MQLNRRLENRTESIPPRKHAGREGSSRRQLSCIEKNWPSMAIATVHFFRRFMVGLPPPSSSQTSSVLLGRARSHLPGRVKSLGPKSIRRSLSNFVSTKRSQLSRGEPFPSTFLMAAPFCQPPYFISSSSVSLEEIFALY